MTAEPTRCTRCGKGPYWWKDGYCKHSVSDCPPRTQPTTPADAGVDDLVEQCAERWPGYDKQSWQQRFNHLDGKRNKEFEQSMLTFIGFVDQLSTERQRAERAEKLLEEAGQRIEAVLKCTPYIKFGIIHYDCGDPWEILRDTLARIRSTP